MWALLVTLLVICLTYLGDRYILRPKRRMAAYLKAFTEAGFNFKLDPFVLFGGKIFEYMAYGERVFGNPNHYSESVMAHFDGSISSVMNRPLITITHPDLLQEYFNVAHLHYNKFEHVLENLKRAVGEGIAFSEGAAWRRKRKIISTTFHFDFLHLLIPHIVDTVNETFQRFEQSQPPDEALRMPVLKEYIKVFSQVMIRLFFGCDTSEVRLQGEEPSLFFVNLINQITEQSFETVAFVLGNNFLRWGLRKKDREITKKVKLFNQFARDLIHNKIRELQECGFKQGDRKHGNLVEELYLSKSISQEDRKTEEEYNFKELIEEFCTFLIAGSDTTSNLCAMLVVFTDKLPSVQQRILEELHTHIHTDQDWTPSNIKKLIFLEACLKETMRMFGPVTSLFVREATSDHMFKGVLVRKGTLLNVSLHSSHYSPKYFQEPLKFVPERWLDEKQTLAHPFVFVPFSAGTRNCIGQHLSSIEAKILIGKFFLRYKFRIDEPVRLKLQFLVSPGNFNVLLQRREQLLDSREQEVRRKELEGETAGEEGQIFQKSQISPDQVIRR